MEALREALDASVVAGDLTGECLTASERNSVGRLFYEIEGCTMNSYCVSYDDAHSVHFAELLNTDYSPADIAYRCGFYDQAHFSKVLPLSSASHPGD